jgi:hypothetical protein
MYASSEQSSAESRDDDSACALLCIYVIYKENKNETTSAAVS